MCYKWFGSALILLGCAATGISMTAADRREEKMLEQLLHVVGFMRAQLQYRLTPLPQLCRQSAGQVTGALRCLLEVLAEQLEHQKYPEVPDCMRAALSQGRQLPGSIRSLCLKLGRSLGQLDLNGQLWALEAVQTDCERKRAAMAQNRHQRLHCYQTLSLCAGAALVILLL